MPHKRPRKFALVECKPYPLGVVICVDAKWNEARNYITRATKAVIGPKMAQEILELPDDEDGNTVPLLADGTPYTYLYAILFNRNSVHDPTVLAHESLHVLAHAFPKMGIEMVQDSFNEPWAYSLDQLIEQIIEAFT